VGYEVGEFPIPIAVPHPDLYIRLHRHALLRDREQVPVAFYHHLGPLSSSGQPQLAPYIPNPKSIRNHLAATVHRFGRESKPSDISSVQRFTAYSKAFIKRFGSVDRSDILEFDEWLASCGYSGGRKTQLANLWDDDFNIDTRLLKSKLFLKWEGYLKPKHARGINSYSDESKLIFGPLFKSMDKCFFRERFFTKGTDVSERPGMLYDLFGERPVVETDFTSFESHHRGAFSDIVHYWMMHMMRGLRLPKGLQRLISVAVKGVNVCESQFITAHVPQTLMSGALWTSSSNGLLNLLVMSYLWSNNKADNPEDQANFAFDNFKGLIEGDDGITETFDVDQQLIDSLGIDLKLESVNNYGEASFCGIVCPVGSDDVLYDPKRFLRNFFWLPSKFERCKQSVKDGYIRAKALSYAHNFGGSPIVGPISRFICEHTKSINIQNVVLDSFDSYKREQLEKTINTRPDDEKLVSDASREHVALKFGMSIKQQLHIENRVLRGESVDLSLWMMPDDDDHNLMHITEYESDGIRWTPNHLPPILAQILRDGHLGIPSARKNKELMPRSGSRTASA